jgi:tetratricopeptide (TPR) repeat protein
LKIKASLFPKGVLGLVFLAYAVVWNLSSALGAVQEPLGSPSDFEGKLKDPKRIAMDFETYKNTIDDLFFTALIVRPESKRGMNEIIIDLNRKLAESPNDVETLTSLGHLYRLLKQPAEANKFYEKALALKPETFHLYCFSAMMYYQIKDFPKALEQLDHSLKINADDVDAWLGRGRTLIKLGKESEAAESYEKALSLDPDSKEAMFTLGVLYRRSGKFDEAEKLFENLTGEKDYAELAAYHLGAISVKRRQPEQAIKHWEPLFLQGIRDPEFLFNLSLIYLENKDYTKAEAILKPLQLLYTREISIQFFLGELYRHMERFADAEQMYRFVIVEDPQYGNAYTGLAFALAEQGKTKEAIGVLDSVMDGSKESKDEFQKWKRVIEDIYVNKKQESNGSIPHDTD